MSKDRYIGLYSQKATRFGTSIYSTPDGGEVEVTCVGAASTVRDTYLWDDAVDVGPVKKWLRTGRQREDYAISHPNRVEPGK